MSQLDLLDLSHVPDAKPRPAVSPQLAQEARATMMRLEAKWNLLWTRLSWRTVAEDAYERKVLRVLQRAQKRFTRRWMQVGRST